MCRQSIRYTGKKPSRQFCSHGNRLLCWALSMLTEYGVNIELDKVGKECTACVSEGSLAICCSAQDNMALPGMYMFLCWSWPTHTPTSMRDGVDKHPWALRCYMKHDYLTLHWFFTLPSTTGWCLKQSFLTLKANKTFSAAVGKHVLVHWTQNLRLLRWEMST